jgi:hypothetical protein
MEWFLSGMYWAAMSNAYTFPDPGCTKPAASPTELDLWLIRLVYAAPAGQTPCVRCGAPLDRRLRLATQYGGGSPYWRVSVAARCHGWRRHRHVALVIDSSSGLQLGPFRGRPALGQAGHRSCWPPSMS